MSWSWNVTDKAVNLTHRVIKELGDITLSEPEQTIKNSAAKIVELACMQMPDDLLVHVYAYGSQYAPALAGSPRVINAFHLLIEEYVTPALQADVPKAEAAAVPPVAVHTSQPQVQALRTHPIAGATAPQPFPEGFGAAGGPPTTPHA